MSVVRFKSQDQLFEIEKDNKGRKVGGGFVSDMKPGLKTIIVKPPNLEGLKT